MTKLTAMFDNVKDFAVFNAKPHLFTIAAPTQMFCNDIDHPVYVELESGCAEMFTIRVKQFGGLVLPNVD